MKTELMQLMILAATFLVALWLEPGQTQSAAGANGNLALARTPRERDDRAGWTRPTEIEMRSTIHLTPSIMELRRLQVSESSLEKRNR